MGDCILTRRGGSSISLPDFTYTGTYEAIDDGDGNWRMKFTTSGVLTLLNIKELLIDVFLVGGGGAGAGYYNSPSATSGGGGGGGYTTTSKQIKLSRFVPYAIQIGTGVISSNQLDTPTVGGTTSAFGFTANGGNTGSASVGDSGSASGGDGGSGGGCQSTAEGNGAAGGSDGSNGVGRAAGSGQGTTTREFGEPGGDLYSGGGGAGGSGGGAGGAGGGGKGNGGHATFYGGGGGGMLGGRLNPGGNGYQGIAIIRNAREAAT